MQSTAQLTVRSLHNVTTRDVNLYTHNGFYGAERTQLPLSISPRVFTTLVRRVNRRTGGGAGAQSAKPRGGSAGESRAAPATGAAEPAGTAGDDVRAGRAEAV